MRCVWVDVWDGCVYVGALCAAGVGRMDVGSLWAWQGSVSQPSPRVELLDLCATAVVGPGCLGGWLVRFWAVRGWGSWGRRPTGVGCDPQAAVGEGSGRGGGCFGPVLASGSRGILLPSAAHLPGEGHQTLDIVLGSPLLPPPYLTHVGIWGACPSCGA